MKKWIISLFLIVVGVIAFKSFQTSGIDDKSKRNENWIWWIDAKTGEGKWIPMGEHDQVQKDGHGQTLNSGRFYFFYPNGNLFEKGRLEKNVPVDTIYRYDLKGQLQCFSIIPDTSLYFIKDGPIKGYFHDGKIRAEGIVKNHTNGDKWTAYFKNGKIERKRSLLNGRGWTIDYYENGNLKDSLYEISRDSAFPGKAWYENGTLKFEEELTNGRPNRVCKTYYENGQLKQSEVFVNGVCNGPYIYYFNSGKMDQKLEIVNGKIQGLGYLYYETGKLHSIITYKDGERRNIISYYDNGNIKDEGGILNEKPNGEVKHYDENGKLISKIYWKDGQIIKTDK